MLTSSPLDVMQGAQQPRIEHVAPFVSSTGQEAIELAALAGVIADPWQEHVIHRALGEKPDGQWASFEVGLEVPRQNGKGGVLEIRALAGLFLLGERLIIHSAHEFATADEALERMADIIEGCPDLSRRVKTIKRSHGQEGVYLKNGQRLRYKTRTKGGARGFSADCVILDEAMYVPETFLGALMPTLSARPNPQLWYTGSAVDDSHMEHGVVFSRLRQRALKGEDPAMAYFGWSPAFDRPEDVSPEVAVDPEVWAQANPAMGIRIPPEHIAKEHRSMDPRTFAVERLGVGSWPRVDDEAGVIPLDEWDALMDGKSQIVGPISLSFDVTPDRSYACIAAAGRRKDGLPHVEVIEHARGTKWVPDRLVELVEKHDVSGVVYGARAPAASLLTDIENAGVDVEPISAAEHAEGCGQFFDLVDQEQLRHIGQRMLRAAIKGAVQRAMGDGAWGWDRKNSLVDISPLVATTQALWHALPEDKSEEPWFEWV